MKKRLTSYGSFIIMRESLKSTISLLKKCDENASAEQHKTFIDMIAECRMLNEQLHTGQYAETETSGDGLQVAFTFYETICSKLDEIENENENLCTWMRTKRTIRDFDKRTAIKLHDSKALKEFTISPLQEAYRAARDFVQSHVCPDCRRQKAVYIDDETQETIDGILYKQRIYIEIPFAESEIASSETLENTLQLEKLIEKLELTETQKAILKLRLKGYGVRAIGTYKGVSFQAVAKSLKQIQVKAFAALDIDKSSALYYKLSGNSEGLTGKKFICSDSKYYATIPHRLTVERLSSSKKETRAAAEKAAAKQAEKAAEKAAAEKAAAEQREKDAEQRKAAAAAEQTKKAAEQQSRTLRAAAEQRKAIQRNIAAAAAEKRIEEQQQQREKEEREMYAQIR